MESSCLYFLENIEQVPITVTLTLCIIPFSFYPLYPVAAPASLAYKSQLQKNSLNN